jgi:hypothetical protein
MGLRFFLMCDQGVIYDLDMVSGHWIRRRIAQHPAIVKYPNLVYPEAAQDPRQSAALGRAIGGEPGLGGPPRSLGKGHANHQ